MTFSANIVNSTIFYLSHTIFDIWQLFQWSDIVLPRIRRDMVWFTIMPTVSSLFKGESTPRQCVLPLDVMPRCLAIPSPSDKPWLMSLPFQAWCLLCGSHPSCILVGPGWRMTAFPSPLLQLGVLGPSSLCSAPSTQICKLLVTECKMTAPHLNLCSLVCL